MKIGLNLEFARTEGLSFAESLRSAREAGFRIAEPYFYAPGSLRINSHVSLASRPRYFHLRAGEARLREAADLLRRLDMSFSAIDAHTSLLVPEIGVPHITRAMDAAAGLGCRIVVTDEGPVSPFWTRADTAFDVFRTSLDHILEHGRRRGVILAVEPHNALTVSGKYLTALLERYPPEVLGINFDTGNVYLAGGDPRGMLEKLLPRVVHIHGKDIPAAMAAKRGHATGTRVGTAVGSGVVDFRGLAALLKEKSYSGVLSVECDTLDEARRSRDYLESLDGEETS